MPGLFYYIQKMSKALECTVPRDYIRKMSERVLRNLKPVVPTAIVTYGPPASGKSTILDKFLYENPELGKKDQYANTGIDDIVESMDSYQDLVKKVDPLEAYNACRIQVDQLSTLILESALVKKVNVLFETTGNSIEWLKFTVEKFKRAGYRVVLLYPYVEDEILHDRLNERNSKQSRQVKWDFVEGVIANAQKNLKETRAVVDELYVYDNSNEEISMIYSYKWDPNSPGKRIETRSKDTQYKNLFRAILPNSK